MERKANTILIKPNPQDKVSKGGIIIPDTATPDSLEWGEVVDGFGDLKKGVRVLFYRSKAYEEDGVKAVNANRVLYYDHK